MSPYSIVPPSTNLREALLQVVRGERSWRELAEHGASVSLQGGSVSVLGGPGAPIPISAQDVALGWLRHSGDALALREWAQVVHGAVGLFELAFETSPDAEVLLDALWRVSFGESPSSEMASAMRRVLMSST